MTGRVWTPSDWISGNCLWNCIFQTCFFFIALSKNDDRLRKPLYGWIWFEYLTALGKNCMDFWKVWRLLGENFDWNTFIFERGQDFQRNSGVKTRKTITVSKKNTVLEKIDRPLQENRTLLVSKSATAFGKIGAAVFGTKQPPLWGRWAGSGFFFGIEFCKIDQGTAHTIHAMFTDVGSTTRNWFGCFMFSLSKINLKKSIKGWARWRRRPSSSLKLCLF